MEIWADLFAGGTRTADFGWRQRPEYPAGNLTLYDGGLYVTKEYGVDLSLTIGWVTV